MIPRRVQKVKAKLKAINKKLQANEQQAAIALNVAET